MFKIWLILVCVWVLGVAVYAALRFLVKVW